MTLLNHIVSDCIEIYTQTHIFLFLCELMFSQTCLARITLKSNTPLHTPV